MGSVVAGTSALVPFLADRDPGQQARAAELNGRAAELELGEVLRQAVVIETASLLRDLDGVSRADTAVAVRELLAMPGVAAVDEVSRWPVRDLSPVQFAGLGAGVLAAMARVGRHGAGVIFDPAFRRRPKGLSSRSCW